MDIYHIFAFLPFLIIIYFLLIKNKKTSQVLAGTYFFTLVMLFFLWKVNLITIGAASAKGFLQALEIFLIIFSILLIFNLMKEKDKLKFLKTYMKSYSEDKNILIILIGFFLVSFIESIAGFGTPAAIAVPILIFLGIAPLTAVIVCLISDSVAVAFGAFGTPILFGISSVPGADLSTISINVGIINGIIGMLLPTIILIVYNKLEKNKFSEIKKYLSFSLFAGFSFELVYILSSIYLIPELVSVTASVIGFILTLIYLKYSGFIKNEKRDSLRLIKDFMPYVGIVILFAISRISYLGIGAFLKKIGIKLNFGQGIDFSFNLYSPGFLILIVFVIFVIVYKLNKKEIVGVVKNSFESGKNALITLIFTLGFVQLLIFSNLNNLGVSSIPYLIGEIFSKTGIFYIILSPLIGAFGSFITGSATVSNLIFANLQANTASLVIYPQELILALQTVGASAGNMIAIHNIIAACSLAGLKDLESKIIKINIKIVGFYCLIGSAISLLIFFF